MRLIVLAATVAALTGCAAPAQRYQAPPAPSLAELRAIAPTVSDYRICRAVVIGTENAPIAGREEQQRRGLDCGPYVQAIVNEQRQQGAPADPVQTMLLLNAMQQASQPVQLQPLVPVPPPAKPVNCTSQRLGNQVQTNCY